MFEMVRLLGVAMGVTEVDANCEEEVVLGDNEVRSEVVYVLLFVGDVDVVVDVTADVAEYGAILCGCESGRN